MPTFKTTHNTVMHQSAFPGGRLEGCRRLTRITPGPGCSPATAGGPTEAGSPGACKPACQSFPGRTDQATAHHVKLPFPEPKTRTAREPPTEGSRVPTLAVSPRSNRKTIRGSAVPACRVTPHPASRMVEPLRLWVAPSSQSPPPEPSTGSGMAGTGLGASLTSSSRSPAAMTRRRGPMPRQPDLSTSAPEPTARDSRTYLDLRAPPRTHPLCARPAPTAKATPLHPDQPISS